ncbi:hypothetical protein HJG60_007897 [Phyllostomus discolor]|uniref:Uncharacterized protein n=1 Tax=Phyllostomus discolor TaxID=89673 RepID=A0A834EVR4_9CHIR|nr:hypothetical protein HJG60_007897 [Phyllostomus discolor]
MFPYCFPPHPAAHHDLRSFFRYRVAYWKVMEKKYQAKWADNTNRYLVFLAVWELGSPPLSTYLVSLGRGHLSLKWPKVLCLPGEALEKRRGVRTVAAKYYHLPLLHALYRCFISHLVCAVHPKSTHPPTEIEQAIPKSPTFE